MVKFLVQWAELGSDKWHSIGARSSAGDAIRDASEFLVTRLGQKSQSAVRVRAAADGTFATVFRASSRLAPGFLELIRKQSLGGIKCKRIEEGDEVYCANCARRWGISERIECGEETW